MSGLNRQTRINAKKTWKFCGEKLQQQVKWKFKSNMKMGNLQKIPWNLHTKHCCCWQLSFNAAKFNKVFIIFCLKTNNKIMFCILLYMRYTRPFHLLLLWGNELKSFHFFLTKNGNFQLEFKIIKVKFKNDKNYLSESFNYSCIIFDIELPVNDKVHILLWYVIFSSRVYVKSKKYTKRKLRKFWMNCY